MTSRADHYKILQVDPEAEAEIITVAYKRLAAKYHPDVNPAPDAERRMRELNAAYEVVGVPARRSDYDLQRLRRPVRGGGVVGAPRRSAPPAAAVFVVAPRSLSFGKVTKGAAPTARLEVGVTGGRTLIGEVRASQPWIQLNVSRLFADRTAIQVTIDTVPLEEGRQYAGAVVVDSIVFGTRIVPVSLHVSAAVRPVLRVTPTLLDFGGMRFGQSPKVLELRISNGGSGHLSGTLRTRQRWLSVSQTAFAADAAQVQVIASGDGLVPGRTYTGEVEIGSNGGAGLIAARLDVLDDQPEGMLSWRRSGKDLSFLEERMGILSQQAQLSSQQKQERNIIGYLQRTCRGGDVADMLQRGVASAQGAEGIGWRDADGVLQGTSEAVAVLGGLLERLRKWEEVEA